MAYFVLTLLYTILVPAAIFFICNVFLHYFTSALVALGLCFAMMLRYGYRIDKSKRNKNPESMIGIYLPVFLPLIFYLFCAGILNFNDFYGKELWLGVLTLNWFGLFAFSGQILGLSQWHSILLLNLSYYCVLILGFTVGERLSSHKMGVKRKPFSRHKKMMTAVFILSMSVLSVYVYSEFDLYERRKNIVESAYSSYNFPYAGGYSSIDLQIYNVENEENILAKLEEPSTFIISAPEEMPIMDGAEAAYPVYSAFANACYENIAVIQAKAVEAQSDIPMPVQFSNTIYAYEKLLTGEIDIFFGAKPSEAQIQMAENAGVELMLTPIGKEAFVFFVNAKNPVDGLSSEQLRDIYSGKINNWRKVGGKNKRILAFQRPENSGSQTMMEYFMGDTPLREPLETEYREDMVGIVRNTADYKNSISALGYSFRYYTTIMMNDVDLSEETSGIKILAVDGVYPDEDTIRSGEYPYTTQLYAITLAKPPADVDSKDTIEPFLAWMTGPQGQQLVADTGYVKYTCDLEGNR